MHLHPAWSFSGEGSLWKLLVSDRGKILGEYRNEEAKTARFVCLDETSGRALWRYEDPAEPWWVGLEAVQEDRVLLHGFESPDLPEHKRIIALDLDTGRPVWQNDEVTFWFAYRSRVYAYRTMFERRAGRILDLASGELLESLETIDDFVPLRQLARREDVHDSLDFPEDLASVSLSGDVRLLAEKETGSRNVVGGVEAVLKEPWLVMNYHYHEGGSTPENPRLENCLAILDIRSRQKVFSEVLQSDARLPVPDSFFVRNDGLFFIKDRARLTMVRLPSAGGPA